LYLVKRRKVGTYLAVFGDGSGVDFEDLEAALLVGQRDLDLPVQAAGPQQRRVQRVRPVAASSPRIDRESHTAHRK
jgi:hypothetical protein